MSKKFSVIYDDLSSFVKQDIDYLKADGYHYRGLIREFFYFLTHPYDVYIIYFCNVKAFIPILFSYIYRGKSVIFVGGYDATYIPEINYGAMHGWMKWMNILAYRMAHQVVISSGKELKDRLREHINIDPPVIECGIDTEYWTPGGKRDIDYLTVADLHNESMWIRKGIDRFIELANNNPTKSFVLVNNQLNKNFPDNIIVLPFTTRGTLRSLYRRSKYYCQLSVYESFGIALCEAMSCGCLPIVTNVGVMGDIASGVNTRKEARKKIVDNYDIKIRWERLRSLLQLS